MALIDVVVFRGDPSDFVWKFPSDNLRWGTQLVVKPAQVAYFVKGGRILDEVTEGTVTLKSGNIPLLTTLMSLPFGGDTPFQAEVWFVNLVSKLNNPWGTTKPIQIEDPKYGIVIPVRAFGQYGFRLAEPRKFLEGLVGTAKVFTAPQITDYFNGVLLQAVNVSIGKAMVKENISVLQIAMFLEELSQQCGQKVKEAFSHFGLDLLSFTFQSINVPDNDPSLRKLKEIKEKAAELSVVGRDVYQLDKSMEVLKTAAANEGVSGLLMQSGIGAGMGVMMGAHMGQQAGQMASQMPSAPPAPPAQFFLAVGGQQTGPYPLVTLQQMAAGGTLSASALVWRQGLAAWQAANTIPELASLFAATSPPPLPPL